MSFTHLRRLSFLAIFYPGQRPRISWKNENPANTVKCTLIDSVFCSDSEYTIFILKWPSFNIHKVRYKVYLCILCGMLQAMTPRAGLLQPFARAVLQLFMFTIDAAKTALGLGQIAGSKSTQDPRVAYTLHPTDGNLNFL